MPLWKTPKRFVTNFTEIVLMNHDSLQKRAKRFPKSKKSSFGYQQYLMLFLAMTKQSTRRYRVMDLIQNTMQKNGYKGFKLGSCVYEMKVCGGFLFPSHFFRMAPLESVLGRDVKNWLYDGRSVNLFADISVCYDFNWLSGADDSVSG